MLCFLRFVLFVCFLFHRWPSLAFMKEPRNHEAKPCLTDDGTQNHYYLFFSQITLPLLLQINPYWLKLFAIDDVVPGRQVPRRPKKLQRPLRQDLAVRRQIGVWPRPGRTTSAPRASLSLLFTASLDVVFEILEEGCRSGPQGRPDSTSGSVDSWVVGWRGVRRGEEIRIHVCGGTGAPSRRHLRRHRVGWEKFRAKV